MRGEGLIRFTVSECNSPSQHGMERHGTVTQSGCKKPDTTAACVVTNQEAGSGQNQGLGETNNLQRLSQPGPISWRPHSPARLYQSGKQAIKMQNVWGTIQIQTWTWMSQWEELRPPAEAKLTQYQDGEYSTRGAASHTRIYTWLFFLIPTRQRDTIKSILGMDLKEVTRHRVAHRGWMSTVNEALAPFCPSLGQFLFKAPSNWYLKVYVLSL